MEVALSGEQRDHPLALMYPEVGAQDLRHGEDWIAGVLGLQGGGRSAGASLVVGVQRDCSHQFESMPGPSAWFSNVENKG